MKKITIILMAIAFFGFSSANVYAQDYKHTVGVDVGLSALGGILKAIVKNDTVPDDVSYKTIPVLQLRYGFMINEKISIEAAASHQYYAVSVENTPESYKVKRSNFAVRGLFHYVNKEKLTMYSGIRLGLTKWGVDFTLPELGESDDPTVAQFKRKVENYDKGAYVFAPQLIAFGMRYYFVNNVGVHAEFTIGAPTVVVAGLSFRI